MRLPLTAMMLLISAAALARDDAAIDASELIAQPAKHIGKTVIIRRIQCVDPGGVGFVCAAQKGREGLRVEAGALGAMTDLAIAEKLIGPCKGVKKLESPACTFRAMIDPTSQRRDDGAGGPGTVTVIYSPQIELYVPLRR